jgi:hypothetical protein
MNAHSTTLISDSREALTNGRSRDLVDEYASLIKRYVLDALRGCAGGLIHDKERPCGGISQDQVPSKFSGEDRRPLVTGGPPFLGSGARLSSIEGACEEASRPACTAAFSRARHAATRRQPDARNRLRRTPLTPSNGNTIYRVPSVQVIAREQDMNAPPNIDPVNAHSDVVHWLTNDTRDERFIDNIFAELCVRLQRAGIFIS